MPSKAPTNVRIINHTSPTSLLLLWDPVPQQYLHGILTGYTVRYKAIEQGAGVRIENSRWSTIKAPAGAAELEIPELASYTRYQLSMFAETKVGGGIFSKTVFGGMVFLRYFVTAAHPRVVVTRICRSID